MARYQKAPNPLPASNRAPPPGPGSNGFFRREFFTVGTYAWVAPKDGRVKVQGVGAAAGGSSISSASAGRRPGASGAYGEKILNVLSGDVINIVVGTGSLGVEGNTADRSAKAGTTSISGGPVGQIPLVLEGASDHTIAGLPTGPWDRAFPGAVPVGGRSGSPSSGSPFGAGKVSQSAHSPGWGGDANPDPTGTHPLGSRGRLLLAPFTANATVVPAWWDMSDIQNLVEGPHYAISGRGGAEGVGNLSNTTQNTRFSYLGGGYPLRTDGSRPDRAGYGAGGACPFDGNSAGGPGGDALIILFWDEVTS